MSKAMWVVRAGQEAVFIQEFLQKHMVAIGWGNIGDLANIHSRDAISDLLRVHLANYTTRQNAVNTGQIFRFREELDRGSAVLTYDPGTRIYYVGTVTGDYVYRPENCQELQHTKTVDWVAEIKRDDLSPETKNSLGSIATIFRISGGASSEIEALVSGTPMPRPVPEEALQEAKDFEAEIREETAERALASLQDRLAKLTWDEMQELVAGLLRAIGYKTRVSPPGPDRGKDITASPDGFGFQAPRIVVEVKHRKEAMGAPELRSFAGGLRHDTSGLYVSTGGFSREAKYEADRANHHVALMDAADLSKAVIEHYDKMDTETRAILPLRKLYWPV